MKDSLRKLTRLRKDLRGILPGDHLANFPYRAYSTSVTETMSGNIARAPRFREEEVQEAEDTWAKLSPEDLPLIAVTDTQYSGDTRCSDAPWLVHLAATRWLEVHHGA